MYIRKPLHRQLFARHIFRYSENNFKQGYMEPLLKKSTFILAKKRQRLIYMDFL